MVYTTRLRNAVGAVRSSLVLSGIGMQSREFAEHGEHEPAPDAPLVLVACSGGRDSMALSAVCHIVCAALGVRSGAVIVDHGLQKDSDAVARQAAGRCKGIGLDPVRVVRISVPQAARRSQGVEAAARDARYAAIVNTAQTLHAGIVLLAHTRDDQAETVILSLMRSHGLDAIIGMPRSFTMQGVRFLRPLIDLGRRDTTGICEDLGLSWWDDPTNGDNVEGNDTLPATYPLRSRIRHDLIPYLRGFTGGDVVGQLAYTAKLARIDKRLLDELAEGVAAQAVSHPALSTALLDVRLLADEHPAIRYRVIVSALASLGISAAARHVEAIDTLISDWHGQGAVSLPGEYSATRQKHVIRLCQDGSHANQRCSR